MKLCPDCNGKKVYRRPLFRADDPSIDLADEKNYRAENCLTCKGIGEISGLQYACYMARGGAKQTKVRPV